MNYRILKRFISSKNYLITRWRKEKWKRREDQPD